jgi:chemotaxis protein MotB
VARRKKQHRHEEHENHERWLVSYADFITLLFAFFVVMYSISSLNEGKYRVLSESMVAAFRSSSRALDPIQVGNLARSPRNTSEAAVELPMPVQFTPIVIDNRVVKPRPGLDESGLPTPTQLEQAEQQIAALAEEVVEAIQELVANEYITVRRNKLWLEIELRTSMLFESASAVPSIDAELILRQIARSLREFPNRILVEGFTDDRPINSMVYPSNWELSSARAGAVVRLFQGYGIQPERLSAVGYGEHRPVASNASESGRLQNRRVVIVVVANLEQQPAPGDPVLSFDLLKQRLSQVTAPVL